MTKRRATILCVDDEPTVLVALGDQLRRQLARDVLVEVADDAEGALEIVDETLAEGGHIQVLITDQMMPGMAGDALVARIREKSPDTLSIMLTGQASAEAVGRAVNVGGLYRFLAKPWNQDDLVLTVRGALQAYWDRHDLDAERAILDEVHAAALEMTASVAGADRYERLLGGLSRLARASHAALVRRRDGRWSPIARSPAPPLDPAEPPPEAVGAWDRDAAAESTTRGGVQVGHAWLWRRDPTVATTLSVPLSIGGQPHGLLILGSDRADAFEGADATRARAIVPLATAAVQAAVLVDALEESNERRRRGALELVRQANTLHAALLAGESESARRLREQISAAAHLAPRTRVLLHGAPGAGREAVARAIHAESDRADRILLPVSCAMSRGTSELMSQLELARGGTLYLDGIEYLSERALAGLAEQHARGHADVRILASMNWSPSTARESMPPEGRWHAEHALYIPALRDRVGDLPTIAELLLKLTAHRLGRGEMQFSDESVERLTAYGWPGDVQELTSVIERAVVTSRSPIVEVDEALLESGQTFGSYALVELLGAGGMGEVWRARHRHLLRSAAVKLIRTNGVPLRAETLARFRREAQVTASLRSPHTVELYDFGATDDSGFYYVMELLDGMDLDQLVREHGAMEPARAAYLLAQCLRSLTEAHEAGLVHRDIKPANIFVCRLGADYDFVKLLDFGLVKGFEDPDSFVTRQGAIAGTPMYMSPEHGSGQALDGRSDLYALGAVAYWMITGTRIFQLANHAAVIVAHLSLRPDRPSDRLGRPLPDGLDDWVLSLLEKDPTKRPPSAREALRALNRLGLTSGWTPDDAEAWWSTIERDPSTRPSQLPPARHDDETRPAKG
ncbi:MAG: protein kinase [Sandaracinaceae bacterium]|nr:protein kinase [Sandaracinaceae bacterium]